MRGIATTTERVSGAIRARLRLRFVLGGLGWGLLAGGVLGLLIISGARFAGRADPRWLAVLAPPVAAGLLGGVFGLARRTSLRGAASLADRTLGLKDRLSSALAFGRASAPTPAMAVAQADGERAASTVRASRVAPVRLGGAWAAWPPVVGLAICAALWLPARSLEGAGSESRGVGDVERAAAAETVARASETARQTLDRLGDRGATREQLERLAEIERELLDGTRSPDEAEAEAADALREAAESLARGAESAELADESLRSRLADSMDESAGDSALADALSRGDLEAARDAVGDLLNRLDELSPEERARIAEQLEALADRTGSAPGAEQEPAGAPLDDALRRQGVSEPDRLRESTDAAELREELERQGVEPETAERLAEDLANQNRRERAEREAARDASELSEAASEAAEELREPGERPQETRPRDGEPEGGAQGQQREGQADRQEQGESGQRETSEGQADAQNERRGGERAEETTGERDGRPGEERTGGESEQGSGDRSEQGSRGDPGQESGEASERRGEGQTEERGGAQTRPDRQQVRESGDAQEGERSGGEADRPAPGEGTDPEAGGDEQSNTPARGVRRLREQLERMAERRGEAERRRDASRDLREQAERLLENASPEERRELEELAREMGDLPGGGGGEDGPRPDPAPWATEPFDATGEGSEESGQGRVVGDWLDPDAERPEGGSALPPAGEVREAVRGAERAIERQAVPRGREGLIRRVFERYRERSGEGSPGE